MSVYFVVVGDIGKCRTAHFVVEGVLVCICWIVLYKMCVFFVYCLFNCARIRWMV